MSVIKRNTLSGCILLIGLCGSSAFAQPWLGGGTTWHPFSYADAQGNPRGIAVDVVKRVSEQNGLEVAFLFYPANRLNFLLDNGRLDLNYADSPLWNSADAGQRFVYSQPYLNVRESLYFLSEHPSRAQPLQQLQGLRVGMVRGYAYPLLSETLGDAHLQKVETSDEAALLDLLLRHRVDAIAMVDDVFSTLLASRQLDAARFTRSVQLSDAPLVIKLQRQHADQLPGVNEALRKMKESGEIERIRSAYLSDLARTPPAPE